MKTTTKFFGLALITMAVILMNACKSEKGDIGPAGPAGPTGATGATGATGQTGATGTANVIYSPWVIFPASSSTSAPYLYNFSVPLITQDILDKGVVLCFVRTGSTGSATETYPLPYIFPNSSTASNSEIYASYILSNIKVRTTFSLSGVGFRYIIIPGGIAGGRLQELKSKSYAEIKEMFNILD